MRTLSILKYGLRKGIRRSFSGHIRATSRDIVQVWHVFRKILRYSMCFNKTTISEYTPQFKPAKEYMSKVPYCSAIGSLMYAMGFTRLDLAHVVKCCQHVHGETWEGPLAGCEEDFPLPKGYEGSGNKFWKRYIVLSCRIFRL
ncbi:unnamed protein product [Linum trigynum]|uniref:Uncharacterized protein n=1 Tax=Linum trigynum TaxID=586398 RepID=A0AAV2FK93_9ROSI